MSYKLKRNLIKSTDLSIEFVSGNSQITLCSNNFL